MKGYIFRGEIFKTFKAAGEWLQKQDLEDYESSDKIEEEEKE